MPAPLRPMFVPPRPSLLGMSYSPSPAGSYSSPSTGSSYSSSVGIYSPQPQPQSSYSPPQSQAPCQYHPVDPDPRCLGCRMAMGGQPDSYIASDDFSVQRCYYSDRQPPPAPVEVPAPLSPTSEDGLIPGESDEESYLLRMRYALQELDNQVEFVLGERFLDLGCCPGGFSTYVLSKLDSAVGDGVSLPVELGGHSFAIPQSLRSRFTVHWGDITRFNHALEHGGSGKLDALPAFPIPANTYDLVLADGHFPGDMLKQMGSAHRHARDMLIVSQLLAAVRAVKSGGTILVKLSLSSAKHTLGGFMHRLVIALSRLAGSVPLVALKPKSIYASAGSFYVLVRGVEPVPRRGLELSLESLWLHLLEGRAVDAKTLNRFVSAKETKENRPWLAEVLAPVEDVRREAQAGAR